MTDAIKRVVEWNAARYERVYSHKLAQVLINEEMSEFNDATTEVDAVDGLLDTIYVAIGAMWKYGVDPNDIGYLISQEQSTADIIASGLAAIAYDCWARLQVDFQLTEEEAAKCFNIVCDSNDSKALPDAKVDPSVKANVNKGANFVRPEPKLQEVLNNRKALSKIVRPH